MKADSRSRIRFTVASYRFEINTNNPTIVNVYDRITGVEEKLGIVDLLAAARSLDGVVNPKPEPIGVGGWF